MDEIVNKEIGAWKIDEETSGNGDDGRHIAGENPVNRIVEDGFGQGISSKSEEIFEMGVFRPLRSLPHLNQLKGHIENQENPIFFQIVFFRNRERFR